MSLAKTNGKGYNTFILQVSPMIFICDCNVFIIQVIGLKVPSAYLLSIGKQDNRGAWFSTVDEGVLVYTNKCCHNLAHHSRSIIDHSS
jgi:hypothetical protein